MYYDLGSWAEEEPVHNWIFCNSEISCKSTHNICSNIQGGDLDIFTEIKSGEQRTTSGVDRVAIVPVMTDAMRMLPLVHIGTHL